jgi:ABC-type xylose transport system permease subunit
MFGSRSFILSFIAAFTVSFFGITLGWDTVVAQLIVVVVGMSIGLAIGYTIRRARGDFRR